MKSSKPILLIFFTFFILFAAGAETRFALDLKTDLAAGSLALGLNTASFFLDSGAQADVEINDINALDRSLILDYNESLDKAGTYLSAGLLLLPGISMTGQMDQINSWIVYGAMYAEAFLLTNGSKDLLKSLIPRNRPYSHLGSIPAGEEEDYYNSFPSGHSSYAFLGATFLATTFSVDHPDSPWRLPVIIGSYSLASMVGISRVLSGNHYITDVIAGAAIGSLYGWLVPMAHLKENTRISIIPQNRGLILGLHF